jgi:purine-binding chemotaxis protein CheW
MGVGIRRAKGAAGKNLVGFEVGGVLYAIDIQRVREIVRPSPTLPLPQLPEAVVGVVDHRGDVLPVIDLRKRFDVQPSPGAHVRWLIVTSGDRLAGLVVDRVTDVLGALESDSRELPEISQGVAAKAIRAAYASAGQLLFVLDVDALTEIARRIALPASIQPKRGLDGPR